MRFRFQRIGSWVVTVAVSLAVMFLVWPYVDGFVARALRKWAAMALVGLCLVPWFLWETFFPPCVDITAYSDSVDYEFRDEEYAYEFAELNEDAEWLKIS